MNSGFNINRNGSGCARLVVAGIVITISGYRNYTQTIPALIPAFFWDEKKTRGTALDKNYCYYSVFIENPRRYEVLKNEHAAYRSSATYLHHIIDFQHIYLE
ncbi:MAG: hypothetical protein ACYCZJ_14045 [Sulfuriferula sp.]